MTVASLCSWDFSFRDLMVWSVDGVGGVRERLELSSGVSEN